MTETAALTLSSDISALDRVAEFSQHLARITGCDADHKYRISLILSEAVTNAIIHGNKNDRSKSVVITTLITDSELWMSVSDQGNGFDHDLTPDPVNKENLTKISGRGIWLIHEYADHVTFSHNGSTVNMLINLC